MVRGRCGYKRRARDSEHCYFEYKGRGSQAKEGGQPAEDGEDEDTDSLEPPEETSPVHALTLAH